MPATKKDIIDQLQKDILRWQGSVPPPAGAAGIAGLGPIEAAFPNAVFPTGAIHEFLTEMPEHAAASGGFIGGILNTLMQNGGACLWISLAHTLFPPALKAFGVEPDRVIFITLSKDKEVLWVMEEALKCAGLAAVVGELREIDFKQSRRLQLAVEQSHVTGFVMRTESGKMGSTACAARWQIKPLPGEPADGLPGLGFPRWQVELLRVRNGRPGSWTIEWLNGKFNPVEKQVSKQQKLMVG